MKATATLLPLFLLLAACGGDEAPAPTGPTYLGNDVEGWAANITAPDLRKQETELNRLSLGRPDVIPVLIGLFDHGDERVVSGAFSALEANLMKVERQGGDPAPWLPAYEKAAECAVPGVAEAAAARLAELTAE